jgi:hypothetical protein
MRTNCIYYLSNVNQLHQHRFSQELQSITFSNLDVKPKAMGRNR